MIGILYFDETDVWNLSETIGNSKIICQVLFADKKIKFRCSILLIVPLPAAVAISCRIQRAT
ncbi:hypothetical protein RCO48_32815 [Peribacillus frigoritolerans]|nr:hypothetical protein [Peribacillus frigoritolerans]